MMYECPVCGKEYKSKGWLDKHVAKVHGGEVTEETVTSSAPDDGEETTVTAPPLSVSTLGEEYDPRWLTECPSCGHVIPKSVAGCWYCEYIMDDNIRGKVPEKKQKIERKKRGRKKK